MPHRPELFLLPFVLLSCCAASRTQSGAGGNKDSRRDATTRVRNSFERHHAIGAFALQTKQGDGPWRTITNGDTAREPQIPASTFKIAHTLIALQTNVVDANTVFPWDGTPRSLKAWQRDLTLKEAIQLSCVPCYQQVARRIGPQKMQQWLRRLGYGNATIGDSIDRFWLDGPLRISALEQVNFLRRLHDQQLPIDRRHQRLLRHLLLSEEAGYRIYAKTGWSNTPQPAVGWYVGWLASGDAVDVFATMLRLAKDQLKKTPTLREDLTLDILRELGRLRPL